MDLISVIIPYYKKKEYIVSSINSVLKQSYKNLELIIIYDDSNLDDLIVLNNIKKKDKMSTLIVNKHAPRNELLEMKANFAECQRI